MKKIVLLTAVTAITMVKSFSQDTTSEVLSAHGGIEASMIFFGKKNAMSLVAYSPPIGHKPRKIGIWLGASSHKTENNAFIFGIKRTLIKKVSESGKSADIGIGLGYDDTYNAHNKKRDGTASIGIFFKGNNLLFKKGTLVSVMSLSSFGFHYSARWSDLVSIFKKLTAGIWTENNMLGAMVTQSSFLGRINAGLGYDANHQRLAIFTGIALGD